MLWVSSNSKKMSIYTIINIHLSILLRLFLWGSRGGWRLSQLPYGEGRCIPWTGCQSDAGHSFKIQLPHAQGQLQIGFLGWCRRMWPSLHRTPTSLQPTPLGWIATLTASQISCWQPSQEDWRLLQQQIDTLYWDSDCSLCPLWEFCFAILVLISCLI